MSDRLGIPFDGDPLAFWGRLIIEDYHASLLEKLGRTKIEHDISEPDSLELSVKDDHALSGLKIGILGAGASGLYTALILDSLELEYEILEASDRVGGRISTYHFPGGEKYDYYEEGAMRFPLPKKNDQGRYKNGTMKRLAELIEYGPLNEGPDPLKDKLIPYYYSARDPDHPGVYYFNSVFEKIEERTSKGDFDGASMGVDAAYIRAGSGAILEDVLGPFMKGLVEDYETGGKHGWALIKEHDAYSLRGYMATKYLPSDSLGLPRRHLSNDIINWCSMLESSGGGFNGALSEAIVYALTHTSLGNWTDADVDWKCFEGGSEALTNKMESYINSKGVTVNKNKRVTAIREATREGKNGATIPCISVTTIDANGSESNHDYSHVISTLSLPALRILDLDRAGLNTMQKNALRCLCYGPSVKVAILFKSNWWTTKLGIVGGQSYTDLPIRTIVYPSYGVESDTPSKVLIASYTWTTDASRLAALAAKNERGVLKELVLRNLVQAHRPLDRTITYGYLLDQYVDMHVKDWNADEYAMGAFADFGPGEFERLYASLNFPAGHGRLHFAGEAISTRHSWVVGALDGAWRAVYEYLSITNRVDRLETFEKLWGENVEWSSYPSTRKEGPGRNLFEEHVAIVQRAFSLPNLSE